MHTPAPQPHTDINPALLPAPRRQAPPRWAWLGTGMAALLASCAAPVPAPQPAPEPVALPAPAPAPVVTPTPALVSQAATARAYRDDGARHIYSHNAHRIFKGKLPPLLHAVGVLQVEVDGLGHVQKMHWMRAPSHAPDVVREIERTVLAAAPYPAPVRLGSVTYTDVWLWDKSGHFQLDTLTEGQRSK